jgi:hypothetical protein
VTRGEALARFIEIASTLKVQLNDAITSGKDKAEYFGNAEVALSQVSDWLQKAKAGTLPEAYGPAGFGISKSDLMFGRAEAQMHELERIYRDHLSHFTRSG